VSMSDKHDHASGKKVRAAKIRRIFKHNPKTFAKSVLQYFQEPSRDIIKLRRARSIEKFCERRKHAAKPGSDRRDYWAKRKVAWTKRADKLEAKIAKQAQADRRVIPRSEWGAPGFSQSPMSSTSNGLFVHHTVAGAPLTPEGEKAEMRNLDAIARSRGYAAISYSFVIFDSGRIYEGRGKGVAGAHTLNYNSTAYGAAASGNRDTSPVPQAMVDAYRWLRREYLGLGSAPLRPHSSVYGTACPGGNLRDKLGQL
jgi:hypothetical protein